METVRRERGRRIRQKRRLVEKLRSCAGGSGIEVAGDAAEGRVSHFGAFLCTGDNAFYLQFNR